MICLIHFRNRQMTDQHAVRVSHFYRQTLVDVDIRSHVFDPTRDRHAWNKWRIAVNNTLVDNVKLREQHKQLKGYSHSLTEAPLSEYLLVLVFILFNGYVFGSINLSITATCMVMHEILLLVQTTRTNNTINLVMQSVWLPRDTPLQYTRDTWYQNKCE